MSASTAATGVGPAIGAWLRARNDTTQVVLPSPSALMRSGAAEGPLPCVG